MRPFQQAAPVSGETAQIRLAGAPKTGKDARSEGQNNSLRADSPGLRRQDPERGWRGPGASGPRSCSPDDRAGAWIGAASPWCRPEWAKQDQGDQARSTASGLTWKEVFRPCSWAPETRPSQTISSSGVSRGSSEAPLRASAKTTRGGSSPLVMACHRGQASALIPETQG